MRLAISNIAWDPVEDEAIAKLLRRFGVDAIDVAPGKYFPEPAKATEEDIARVKNELTEKIQRVAATVDDEAESQFWWRMAGASVDTIWAEGDDKLFEPLP